MKKRTHGLLIIMFAILVLSLHLGFKQQPDVLDISDLSKRMRAPLNWQGKFAPDFELAALDGTRFKLSEHIGKEVIVLNFFATWCGPCNEEMPELVRFYNDNSGGTVAMLGIDAAEKEVSVQSFINQYSISYPVGIDNIGDIRARYGVNSFPTTVVVGADGKIKLYEIGAIMNADIAFKKLMDEETKAIQDGKGISSDDYLKGVADAKFTVITPDKDNDEVVLEGRAKDIASVMTCPCGCSDKVVECGCDTAKKIKNKLKEGDFGEKSDVDIIKELNAEFCVKEKEC